MSWLEHLREPLASTREEATRYIRTEIERALPRGWMLQGAEGDGLAWRIVKTDIQAGEWPDKDYGVRLASDLHLVVFTYGNKDIGPWSLEVALLRSLVIEASVLRHFGMAECLTYLMSYHEPNEWGYT